jgi:hypothetical protein
MRESLGFALILCFVALGCENAPSGTAPTSSATPAKAASSADAMKPATPSEKAAPPAEVKPAAQPASAAASFPATALPAKDLAGFTIGVPTGGKLDKSGDDRASLETADYKLMLKKAGEKETIAELKEMVQKMKEFKAITVDQPDGLVVEIEEKGAKQFLITRYVKVGDVTVSCENALTKPPKDPAKAQEAFDVCGTIKKP